MENPGESREARTRPEVFGRVVDGMTRCAHYHRPEDIIAIRFKCCDRYYPCHLCHAEAEAHEARQWTVEERGTAAILCGACGAELTIGEYMGAPNCPRCRAAFNLRCVLHHHLYFETD